MLNLEVMGITFLINKKNKLNKLNFINFVYLYFELNLYFELKYKKFSI
jgi:hypothetical protein